ncbi:MAG: hypothetical protein KGO52_05060 [Nitrospirota bacterium]|nr:hypothetical protein [Nitrospirota bacterium]MDE3242076.1 hypothetical protein [Nitrospirota bacterium]
MLDSLASIEFLKFAVPALGAIFAWFFNEWRKLRWEQYLRKEEKYKELVRCVRGFYEGEQNALDLRNEFINQLNQSWLYCPDDVIRKAYAFLSSVHTGNVQPDDVRERALGELMVAIRQDLLSRRLVRYTELGALDFKHMKANVPNPSLQTRRS